MEEDIKQNIFLNYKTNATDTAKQVDALTDSTTEVSDAKARNVKETKAETEVYKSYKTQVREATAEQLKMAQIYGLTSKEAVEATKKLAGLKDEMADAKSLTDGFNPDRKFQGLATAVNAAAVAASGVTSGMALFGAESAQTEKALLKVQAAMAFSDAVGRITEMGDDFRKLKAQITSMFTTLSTAKTVDTTATTANNASKAEGLIVEGASTVATVAKTGAITGSTIATTAATIATNIFNASMAIALAPITLIIAGIALLVGGIGYLTGAFGDFSGETARAEKANKSLSKEIDSLTKSSKKQAEATELSNYQTLGMAKASGASATEIRKLSEELLNQEVAEKRVNAVKSYSIYLEAKRVAGLSDATDAQKETLKKSIESYNDINGAYNDSVKAKNKLIIDNNIAEKQEATDLHAELLKKQKEASDKLAEERKKANDKRIEDARKLKEDLLSADGKALIDLQNLNDKTDQEKLDRQKERDLKDIEILRQKGADVSDLLVYNNEKYATLQQELDDKKTADAEAKRLEDEAKSKENQDAMLEDLNADADKQIEIDKRILEQKQANKDRVVNLGEQLIANVAKLAGKNKGLQKAAIIADGAIALGKAGVNTAEAVTKDLAKGAPFSAPLVALDIAVGATSAAAIIQSTSKALSAVGGGGSISSGGGGSMSSPGAGALPQVGFQNSSENQIANAVKQNTEDAPPIKAYMVSSEVTTAQNYDRNKITANSLGG